MAQKASPGPRPQRSSQDNGNTGSLNVTTQASRTRSTSSVNLGRKPYLNDSTYVERVRDHSEKTALQSLYSAKNFAKLVEFLGENLIKSEEVTLGRSLEPPDSPLFATLYLLQGHVSAPKDFAFEDVLNATDLQRADELLRKKAKTRGVGNQLLFLRGFPTSAWLRRVGSYYTVDPEFFRRHLDFSLFAHQQWFSSPSLPSTSSNFIRLRVTSLFTRTRECPDVDEARSGARESMRDYIEDLSEPYQGSLGESIVRRFSVHDRLYCSLEQDISLCCCRSAQGWTVIAWMDSGKDLEKCHRRCPSPWKMNSNTDAFVNQELVNLTFLEPIPTIRNEPRSAIHTSTSKDISEELKKRVALFETSRALLSLDYGRHFEDLNVFDDALYATVPIFKFKAAAESQFLNLVDAILHNHLEEIGPTVEFVSRKDYLMDLRISHDDFAYHRELLEHHVSEIFDNIRAIRAHGTTRWPTGDDSDTTTGEATEEDRQADAEIKAQSKAKVKTTLKALEEDYVWLHERAKNLSGLCDRAMKDIHNKRALAESQGANEQTEKINELTRMATFLSVFYVPLSFTSGFFGMNFHVFGQGHVPLWVYFAVSMPLLICSIFFMFGFKFGPKPKRNGGAARLWNPKRWFYGEDGNKAWYGV